MTVPLGDDGIHALLGQILTKQGEIAVQVAVISKTLESIPDHENRIRALERWRWSLPASALAAAGSGIAAWLAYLHH